MRRRLLSVAAVAAFVVLATALAACSSDAEDVCDDVGDCSRSGDTDWIQQCNDESKALEKESRNADCGGAYDDLVSCERSSFACTGVTSRFPGCEDEADALGSCLTTTTATTSCTALAAAEAACAPAPDAGNGANTGPGVGGTPAACTPERDCEAKCFLDAVSNVCAPRVDELSANASCTASCPP